jgi:uncharacterized protein (TIGR00266 family)
VDVSIRHNPGFGIARVLLAPGERVKVESGAMAAHSAGLSLQSEMQGGLFKSLKRAALGGESLFVTTYTAAAGGGWLDVASTLPGDMHVFDLTPERALIMSRGSWLASADSVELDTRWGGFRSLFGGEGGFMVHATGHGKVVVASYGALDVVTLEAGQGFTLDSGHLVAFDEGVQVNLRKAAPGVIQSLKSGEGLVFDFTGPGRVLVQTHNQTQLIAWLTNALPFSRSGGDG